MRRRQKFWVLFLFLAGVIVIWGAGTAIYSSPDQPYDGDTSELKFIKVKVVYKDPYFYTAEGLPGYYIGLPMTYELHLTNTGPRTYPSLAVTATHEYYESGTCDRWWYPYPREVEYAKGESLPGDSTEVWSEFELGPYQTIILSDSYTSTLETCSGLDQTHVIITHPGYFEAEYVLLVGGSLNIAGSSSIQGANGSVHANGNILISGSPTIEHNVSSTGTIEILGNPDIGGSIIENVPAIAIPVIDPTTYKSLADYILKNDGNAYDQEDNLLGASPFRGWNYLGSGKWSFSGDASYEGTYYIEGDAEIASNPGTLETPWQTTILAEGYIKISGNPTMKADIEGVAFMAGGDIYIMGTPNDNYEGLIATHEQIKIEGNPQIAGVIWAEDAEDLCDLVSTGSEFDVSVSGNPDIIYKEVTLVYDEPEAGVFCPPPPGVDTFSGSSSKSQGKDMAKCGCVGWEALILLLLAAFLKRKLIPCLTRP